MARRLRASAPPKPPAPSPVEVRLVEPPPPRPRRRRKADAAALVESHRDEVRADAADARLASLLAASAPERRKRTTRRTRAKTDKSVADLTVVRPDRDAWLRAVRLAHGDVRRLRVLNECTVLVLNNPA